MKIYFVRHGKTQWNLERRLQGQKGDSPLLPEAYDEIKHLRVALQEIHFDEILSSPAKRALTTAKLLSDQVIKFDERLKEWNFGELEGCLIKEAVARYPHEMATSRSDLVNFDGSVFGAESVKSVLHRFDLLGQELLASEQENILLVGHGASGTAGIRHLAGFPLNELRSAGGLNNNTVTILESIGSKFQMVTWNKHYD